MVDTRTLKEKKDLKNYLLDNVKEIGIVDIILNYEIDINDNIILDKYKCINKNGKVFKSGKGRKDLFISYLFFKDKDLTIDFMKRNDLFMNTLKIRNYFLKDNLFKELYKLNNYNRILEYLEINTDGIDMYDIIDVMTKMVNCNNFKDKKIGFIFNLDKINHCPRYTRITYFIKLKDLVKYRYKYKYYKYNVKINLFNINLSVNDFGGLYCRDIIEILNDKKELFKYKNP